MEYIKNLLKVKSLVTLLLTFSYIYLSITGTLSDQFQTIYLMIISFYFGTQLSKKENNNDVTQI